MTTPLPAAALGAALAFLSSLACGTTESAAGRSLRTYRIEVAGGG